MSIAIAQPEHAREMARVLYEALRPTPLFATVYPDVKAEDWIDKEAVSCLRHIQELESIALVMTDEQGPICGMAYGRFLGQDFADANAVQATSTSLEREPMGNRSLKLSLVRKYGGILCEWDSDAVFRS